MAKKAEQKEVRTRTWTGVVYPESAPENWRELINEMHFPWVESPLHDKDKTAAGDVKKPHYHILFMFDGVKSYEQVKAIMDAVKGPIPERCHNAKALVRYMAHLDDPNKAQYSVSDIVAHGGADLAEMLRPSSSERYTIIAEMIMFIKDNRVTEFQDLMDHAMMNERDRWWPALCDNSAVIVDKYIKSQRHRQTPRVDHETGEIIE